MAPGLPMHAFPPGLERYGATLQPLRPGAVPLPDLLRPEGMRGLAAAHGAALSSTDHRAVLSMWSQHYLLALVPAVVATIMLTTRQPELDLETARVVLSPAAGPEVVCVPEFERVTGTDCPARRLTPLLRTHLEPLGDRLAAAGLHRAVTWSNAAHVLSWSLATIRAERAALHRLSALLRHPLWIDGAANPLHAAMCQDGRAVCCLRHRLPGQARCATCPRHRSGAGSIEVRPACRRAPSAGGTSPAMPEVPHPVEAA